jgi:hypothetical protein
MGVAITFDIVIASNNKLSSLTGVEKATPGYIFVLSSQTRRSSRSNAWED